MNITLVCPDCGMLNRVPDAKLAAGPRCGACKSALFKGEPLEVDETKLTRHVTHDGIPVLVDVWAAWCGPCRSMAPQFSAAARHLEPRVRLLKLDADRARNTMDRYGISSIPTLLLFANGQLRGRQAGTMSAAQIAQFTSSHQAI